MTSGLVVWLTGLPAAGKTTIGDALAVCLGVRRLRVERLDGDVVRDRRPRRIGYSRGDRDENVAQIARLGADLARDGAVVVVSAISPYRDARQAARSLVEEHAAFVEVHVATPLDECVRRDPNGLYAKAIEGEIANFTGISDPYEEPATPDLRLDTIGRSVRSVVRQILVHLEQTDLVPAATGLGPSPP